MGRKLELAGFHWPGAADYQLCVESGETLLAESASPVRVGREQLWQQSWYAVSLEQLDVRAANAYRSEGGWRDCGSELREISSHAIMLEALCDLLESGRLDEQTLRMAAQKLLDSNRVGAEVKAEIRTRRADRKKSQ